MIKRVVAGSSGLSILATTIYFLTRHISEVQYNNGGTGVGNDLLKISGTGNCDDSNSAGTQGDEYHKACIKKDIEKYGDLSDFGNNNDRGKTGYDGKLKDVSNKDKYLKFGSGEKFREVCTKGIDGLMKTKNGSMLSGGVGPTSHDTAYFPGISEVSIGDCIYNTKPNNK